MQVLVDSEVGVTARPGSPIGATERTPMTILKAIGVAIVAAMLACAGDAAAQAEVFSAQIRNNYGTYYSLTICKTGNRLEFKMSGMARCDATDLKNDGTFLTYCGGFLSIGSARGQLSGNLETATLEPIAFLGGATFKLIQRPLVNGKAC